jgi:hypothetical protein
MSDLFWQEGRAADITKRNDRKSLFERGEETYRKQILMEKGGEHLLPNGALGK